MNDLIPHPLNGAVVSQRITDGYVNATAFCKAEGKHWNHYASNASTQAFIAELARSTGIPGDVLIQSIATGLNENRGTWVHPQVAVNMAQWASAAAAVQVSKWVMDWMVTGKTPAPSYPAIPSTFAQALQLAADQAKQIDLLASEKQILADRNTVLEPSHAGIHRLAKIEDEISMEEAAKLLSLKTIKELREHCKVKGWIYRRVDNQRWRVTQAVLGRYAVEKAPRLLRTDIPADKIDPTIYITAKGLAILARDFGRTDIQGRLSL